MEKKTKHRILGVLVVIGIVIILLPLFQSEKEAPVETTLVKAPPFPGQAPQVASNPSEDTEAPLAANQEASSKVDAPKVEIPSGSTPDQQQNLAVTQPDKTIVNQQPDDTINANRLPAIDSQASASDTVNDAVDAVTEEVSQSTVTPAPVTAAAPPSTSTSPSIDSDKKMRMRLRQPYLQMHHLKL